MLYINISRRVRAKHPEDTLAKQNHIMSGCFALTEKHRISMIHHRRSIRLKDYDYSQPEAYFVTLVAKDRECLFGKIVSDKMQLNMIGQITASVFQGLSKYFDIILDIFVIMPNHIHAIIFIDVCDDMVKPIRYNQSRHLPEVSSPFPKGTKPGSLGAIVQNFKSVSTRRINTFRRTPGASVWQRNYYDHIIRNEDDLDRIREYITGNPLRWVEDEEYQPILFGDVGAKHPGVI